MTTEMTTLSGRNIIDLIESNSLSYVAKLVGVTPKTVRDKLKKAGFEQISQGVGKPSKWTWNSDQPENDETIFEVECEVENEEEESESETNVNSPSHTVHTQFTREDLTFLIQETVKTMQEQAPTLENKEEDPNIYERIRVLPMDNKTRKTVVINEGISIALDKYCHEKKLNKSDVMHLALKELLMKEGAEL